MSSRHFVITVERQYGSGGRLTSERLARELGIHFYDEDIFKNDLRNQRHWRTVFPSGG